MRVIVFFDLPMVTLEEKKQYRLFRKFLIRKGFMQLQESVYCKLALNPTVAAGIIQSVKANRPPEGLVQMLTVTEKQFGKMEYVVGEKNNTIIDSEERLVIL